MGITGKTLPNLNLTSVKDNLFDAIEGIGGVEDIFLSKDKWTITIFYESPGNTILILQESIKILEKFKLKSGITFLVNEKKYSYKQIPTLLSKNRD